MHPFYSSLLFFLLLRLKPIKHTHTQTLAQTSHRRTETGTWQREITRDHDKSRDSCRWMQFSSIDVPFVCLCFQNHDNLLTKEEFREGSKSDPWIVQALTMDIPQSLQWQPRHLQGPATPQCLPPLYIPQCLHHLGIQGCMDLECHNASRTLNTPQRLR